MEKAELRILSLGAGVQSSTLAIMAARGDIEPIDAAIFADTQAEPKEVYDYFLTLKEIIAGSQYPYPVFTCSKGSLEADTGRVVQNRDCSRTYTRWDVPFFSLCEETGKIGLSRRQCTTDYKINVIHIKIKELLGINKFNKREGLLVDQLIGISKDEAARAKPSRISSIRNIFPLLDLNYNREDCLSYLLRVGLPTPPKSACIFCAFRSDKEWLNIKKNQKEWERVVLFEKKLQKAASAHDNFKGKPFLHRSCIPIDQVAFKHTDTKAVNGFINECEGMCGV